MVLLYCITQFSKSAEAIKEYFIVFEVYQIEKFKGFYGIKARRDDKAMERHAPGYRTKMKISTQGLQLIKTSEGFSSSVYADSVGLKTIGFGHKILPTDNFPVNGIMYAEAVNVLEEDCAHLEFFLNSYTTQYNWTLTQNQFDALMDFGFNLGAGSLHKLMSHGKDQIPTQIVLWDHAGGHVVKGLLDRRVKEKILWET